MENKKHRSFDGILRTLARNLPESKNVAGAFIIGSYSQGLLGSGSDLDLYFLVSKSIPNRRIRRAFYLSSFPGAKLDLGRKTAWGSADWAPVCDVVQHRNSQVDINYASLPWLIDLVRTVKKKGATRLPEFQFRPYTVLGLLNQAKILYDPSGELSLLKQSLFPFPKRLKRNIINENLPIFKEIIGDLQECVQKKVGSGAFIFYLSRLDDALQNLLFAINEYYDPASKRNEVFISNLGKVPRAYHDGYSRLMDGIFKPRERIRLLAILKRLDKQISLLARPGV